MEIREFYSVNDINILSMEPDARTEEEYGLSDLMRLQREGNLRFSLMEYKINASLTIPVLLLHDPDSHIDLKTLNGAEIPHKLSYRKSDFEYFMKACGEKAKDRRRDDYSVEDAPLGKTYGRGFLGSFYNGQTLAIFPNPYAFIIKEVKPNKRYEWDMVVNITALKRKYKDDLKREFKSRQKVLLEQASDVLRKFYEYAEHKEALLLAISGVFSQGLKLFAVPQADIQVMRECRVLPYIEDKGIITRKDPMILNQEIENMKVYMAKEKIALEDLENVKKELKFQGKNWCYLGKPKIIDGVWKYLLNPYQQHRDNYGWFSLDELKAWGNDQGVIPKNTGSVSK